MKRLLLLVVVGFSLNANAVTTGIDSNREFKLTVTEVSSYYCARSNVLSLESCIEEFNRCLVSIAFDRIKISQSVKFLNAITFCNNSLTEI